LAKVLKASDVSTVVQEYKNWDEKAINAQNLFKKWSSYANFFVFLTACFSAGLLAAGAWSTIPKFSGIIGKYIGFFTLCSIISSVFATVCLNRIRSGKLLDKWMQHRAKAETH
jgi:hypothetical protein